MLIALNSQSERTHGADAIRQEKYHCQQCGQQVMAKKGNIMIHHFAHYPGSPSCVWWEPETPLHLLMKQEIIEILKSDNDTVFAELEYKLNLNGNILFPDVYVELRDGKRIAIECQVSNKPLSDFIEKTKHYSDSNIFTLWIFPSEDYNNDHNVIPSMQRQSHTWNFGRLYLFRFGVTNQIISAHFKGVYKRTVEYNKDDVDFTPDGFYWRNGEKYKISGDYWDWGETFGFEVDLRPRTAKETTRRIIKKSIFTLYGKRWYENRPVL